jgi:hypothetical protein
MPDTPNVDLDELAAELRQSVSREIRWEAEDIEADALKLTLRRRTLSDAVVELLHRGDRVSFITLPLTVTGLLSHCRGDLAVMESGSATVSANLAGPVVVRREQSARSGGSSSTGGPRSFKARLSELELTGEPIGLITPSTAEVIVGRIDVVGVDHVVMTGPGDIDWYIPLLTVALVVQAR